jgi:PAS domain S-box-containing protein
LGRHGGAAGTSGVIPGAGSEQQFAVEGMAALHDVAVAAGGVTEQAELARLVVQKARLIAGGDAAVLRWFEPEASAFRLLASSGTRAELVEDIDLDAQTALGGAFKTRKPVIVNDYASSGQTTTWGRRNKIAAQVAVPLLVEGRPVGTLVVLSFSDHRYQDADALFLSLVAAIVAPALEAARLTKEVRRHERSVAQIYEALPVMVVVYARDGKAIQHNSAAAAALGPEKLQGVRERTFDLYREDGTLIPAGERPFALALKGRAAVRGTIARLGGSPGQWVYIDAVPLMDELGEVEAVVTSAIDITPIKVAQQNERESEQLFSGAFAASGIGMALSDLQGSVLRANPALCRLLGYDECELAGMDARSLVVAEDSERATATMRDLYLNAGPTVLSTDLRVAHKDGRAIWTRLTVSLIRVDGVPRHVLLHLVDVTEERKAEAIVRSEQDRLSEIIDAQRDIAGSDLDIDRLLGALAQRTVRLAGGGAVAVLLPDGANLAVRAAAGVPEIPSGFSVPIDESLAGLAFKTGRLHQVSDAKHDPKAHAATARSRGLGAMIATPLMSGDQTIGVLLLISTEAGVLDEVDVRTIEMVAGFAAAAFERASTARRLKSGEQRVRAVIESAPYPIVIFDLAGRIEDFNPAAEKAFQRSHSDVVGTPVAGLLAARHIEGLGRWLRDGKAAGSAAYAGTTFEATGRRADGTEFPMEIAIAHLPEETQLAAAFLRDLTMRNRLKESLGRLAAVVSSAPVILMACDAAGMVTLAEGRGLSVLGLTPETSVGRDVRELLNHERDAVELFERGLKGENVNGQLHLSRPDVFLEAALSPVQGAGGEAAGVSAVLTDVTDRVRAEVAMRESEAKSRLMAMMNHEVRTPLNSILGFAHLLTDQRVGELNDKQHRYVVNIQVAGNHLLSLVNDSLDLAKLEAGHVKVVLADLPVHTVMQQAADQVRPLAEARGLTLEIKAADGVVAHADGRQLNQVLLNLLSNAIRHTPAAGLVTMSARRSGNQVEITVADNGEGIARADLPRLFEEFFQAGNHAAGGIGLGLAISRRLVQMMGGSIGVESELGQGSDFTVRLPAGG